MGGAGAQRLPLRPQTVGELLDAATNLLRRNALPLICTGFVLALAEQCALYPLRRAAGVTPPWYLPTTYGRLSTYWILLAVGFGTETVMIVLLGGLAARASVADLTGSPPPRRLLGRDSRPGALAALAVLLGAGAAVGSAAALVPGLFWYLLAGLAAPVLVVDRRPPARQPAGPFAPIGPLGAIGRSMALVTRGGWRPAGIRLLGYLAWWVIRIGLGAGSIALLSRVVDVHTTGWVALVAGLAWTIVNALAYPALACLDAVVHLENRMRVEGLDIALSRALRRDRPTEPALAVPR